MREITRHVHLVSEKEVGRFALGALLEAHRSVLGTPGDPADLGMFDFALGLLSLEDVSEGKRGRLVAPASAISHSIDLSWAQTAVLVATGKRPAPSFFLQWEGRFNRLGAQGPLRSHLIITKKELGENPDIVRVFFTVGEKRLD